MDKNEKNTNVGAAQNLSAASAELKAVGQVDVEDDLKCADPSREQAVAIFKLLDGQNEQDEQYEQDE